MGGVYDQWGIADGYHDVSGVWHETSPETREALREAIGEPEAGLPLWFVDEGSSHGLLSPCRIVLGDGTDRGEHASLPADLPLGYHRLEPLDGGPATTLVVAPLRCPTPRRGWGVAAQVYSLWRRNGWGIGDLRDVELLGQQIAAMGGTALLLSPFHAPAPTVPQESSPYYPSSRRWLNPLLVPIDGLAPPHVPDQPGGMVDRDQVWIAKRQALAARFAAEGGDPGWRQWARAQGPELWRFATWNALAERHGASWRQWPDGLRHPDSPEVLDLPLRDHGFFTSCELHAWIQWAAHAALARTTAVAGVGLIADLAVGASPDGADAWLHQDILARGVKLGAPPDPLATEGQDWGIEPFVPWRLRAVRYAPFVAMVRAACRGMGGVRIDHILGMFRQFWIPPGGDATHGAYVRMPAEELMAVIRLEAALAGCFVIGEDLGTVLPETIHEMQRSGMLGTKVWWFDIDTAAWPEASLATVTTHDLPTVAGVAAGGDGDDGMKAELAAACPGSDPANAAVELHRQIASSPAALCLATLEDLAGLTTRPNRPGTVTRENWSHRLPADTETILGSEPGRSIVAAMRAARPQAS